MTDKGSNAHGADDPPASAVAQPLLLAIDSAIRHLTSLRAIVAAVPAERADDPTVKLDGKGVVETVRLLIAQILRTPESAAQHYARFAGEALDIFDRTSSLAPAKGDFRFKDRLWTESPFFGVLLQLYLSLERSVLAWLDDQPLPDEDKRRIHFVLEQLTAAAAPSNLPLNPAALRRAKTTEGQSVIDGVRNLIDDVQYNRAMPRQISPHAYRIGVDLAVTPGAVVHRNDQLELIQYTPHTPDVRRRPVLLIPPQINKYYCFDLRPQNSVIAHMLRSGIQIFTLSWRNPSAAEASWNLDTYVGATVEAMDAVSTITRSDTMGLISACAGGLTAMATIGYLAARAPRRVAHHSLLVTSLFPNQGSKLELFATRDLLEAARLHAASSGVMEGEALAKIFSWLRPTDLVWRYWINNYLLGKSPPPLDVLYWDNDSTRLPAGLQGDFIDMYARDVFRQPGRIAVLGELLDFNRVEVDSYIVGGEEDYLMPWPGCYLACQQFRGDHQFVLSNSGHVQSILRPPRLASAHYFTNHRIGSSAAEWRATCTRHEGTWWSHWHDWLNARSGDLITAPSASGCHDYPPSTAAPGNYVMD